MANIFVSSVAYTAVTAWTANTVTTIGTIRRQTAPIAGQERCFRCSTAGTTGATEPTWALTANSTTNDSTVVWTECTGQAIYNGNGGGTAWGAPYARLPVALSFSAAGDTLYLASNHAETGTYTNALLIPGTQAARTRILSVDESVVPASNLTALKIGASLTNTNNNVSSIGGSAAITGCAYMYGVSMSQSGTSNPLITIGVGNLHLIAESCKFQILSTSTSTVPGIYFGQAGSTGSTTNRIVLKNCSFRFGSTAQSVYMRGASVSITNLTIDAAGSVPNTLLTVPIANCGVDFSIADSDLSNVTGNLFTLANTGNSFVSVRLQNCKLGSGVTLPSTVARPGYMFEMQNCDSGSTNYRFYELNFAGSALQNTSISINGLSAAITTVANGTWESPLEFPITPIRVTAGTPVTATYEIACSSQLDNSQAWVDMEFNSDSGSPLGTIATSGTASVTTTGTTIPSSSATWTGAVPAYQQQITVTFTPQQTGWALPVFKLARPSTLVYLDMGASTLVPGLGFSNVTTSAGGMLVHPGMAGGMRG